MTLPSHPDLYNYSCGTYTCTQSPTMYCVTLCPPLVSREMFTSTSNRLSTATSTLSMMGTKGGIATLAQFMVEHKLLTSSAHSHSLLAEVHLDRKRTALMKLYLSEVIFYGVIPRDFICSFRHITALLACLCPLAASLTISVPDPVLEGTNLEINCITSGGGAADVILLQNGQNSGLSGVIQQSNTSVRVFDLGTVDRSNSSTTYRCVSGFDNSMSTTSHCTTHLPSLSSFRAPLLQGPPPSASVFRLVQSSSTSKGAVRW